MNLFLLIRNELNLRDLVIVRFYTSTSGFKAYIEFLIKQHMTRRSEAGIGRLKYFAGNW